jgi:hypothetical protein
MNRRDFLMFLGGAAAAAAVAPEVLADAVPSGSSGWFGATGATGVIGPQCPSGPRCIVVFDGLMTVQEAIDSLAPDGGTVFLPSGTHVVGESITIPQNVEIVGEGNITFTSCSFRSSLVMGKTPSRHEAPITLLMDEDNQVQIVGNVFDCNHVLSMNDWFHVPIGEALASLRRKFRGLLTALRSG